MPLVQILQVKYVPGSTLFHLWEVVQIFQREPIFCTKISSGESLLYRKISSGGYQFWGVHFYHNKRLEPIVPQLISKLEFYWLG